MNVQVVVFGGSHPIGNGMALVETEDAGCITQRPSCSGFER